MKIISNKIKCKNCGDIIESQHTHDYKKCSCGSVAVDGGKSYLKRNFKEREHIEEMSETIGEVIMELDQDDGGYEITLKLEKDCNEELGKKAVNLMMNIIRHAQTLDKLIFTYEFVPYRKQEYRLSFKVESDYDTDKFDTLIEELKEYDTFRADY